MYYINYDHTNIIGHSPQVFYFFYSIPWDLREYVLYSYKWKSTQYAFRSHFYKARVFQKEKDRKKIPCPKSHRVGHGTQPRLVKHPFGILRRPCSHDNMADFSSLSLYCKDENRWRTILCANMNLGLQSEGAVLYVLSKLHLHEPLRVSFNHNFVSSTQ